MGIAIANGRIEIERVDVATEYGGQVAEIRVREGDTVAVGDIVAVLNTSELMAQLAAAKAEVRSARQGIARAKAEVALREAEHNLSELELARVVDLERRQVASTADLERRDAQYAIAKANLLGAHAAVGTAIAATEQAEAHVRQLKIRIDEMTLHAPVDGRVEYRLVQPGTVVGPGTRVATLLDISDVYMTIFLPTSEAGKVAIGAEARIALDAAPNFVLPARVSFVASEAQFTPKAVQTANEREKLMYRVKLQLSSELLDRYRAYVRAGYTGDAYLKLDPSVPWHDDLEIRLPDAP
ncbi:HlyD family secretion protein [Jannaschia helgolandensis]|uniref:HlyD family secretion protein n=1 Tax=Jannaschia helgolandensis TaxID=188906 RepID=UPI0030D6F99C